MHGASLSLLKLGNVPPKVESFGDARLREAFKLFPDQGPCFGGGVDHCFKKIFFARATYGARCPNLQPQPLKAMQIQP